MNRIRITLTIIQLSLISVQGQRYIELENCIKFKCSTILSYNETQAQPGFYSDSNKLNACQADNDNCYLNQFTFQSESGDKIRAQSCYDGCYSKDSYSNDYFKFFLRCSWNCAETVYGIQNNFNKFQFQPGYIVSICLIVVSVLTMAIRAIQIHHSKKTSSQVASIK